MDIAQNLLDTLEAHSDGCVGMAANMIGVSKRIIAFDCAGKYMVMFNPVILKKRGRIRLRRAACPFPEAEGRSATSPSRCSGRTNNFKPEQKPLPAGQRRLSSMKLTTATAF